ncbi:water-specific aquaporin-like protein, partial [Leptotrombidium deliense]
HKFGAELKVGGVNGTANIFVTHPNEKLSIDTLLVDQIVSSSLFLLIVNAIIDKKNMQCPKALIPIAIGLILSAILFAFSFNSGAPLNPARDVAPLLFTWMAGWGKEVFFVAKYSYSYFLVPIIAPHLGAIIGTSVYVLLVEKYLQNADEI